MKKIFTLIASVIVAMSVNAQEQKVWNFSDWEETTFNAVTTIDGLTVMANEESTVVIDGNNKTIEGANNTYKCTKRLKLGGTGSAEARNLNFEVTGPCTINVGLISSSSSADRTLNVATGTFDNVVASLQAVGSPAQEQTYKYESNEPTTVYLYSPSSGVNIYYIEVTYTSTNINNAIVEQGNENAPVYNLAGQRVNKDSKGVLIQNGKKFINK